MKRHLVGALIGILTFVIGLMITSRDAATRDFQQVASGAVWTEDVKCWARNFRDASGNSVTLWSECPENENWSARDEFESEVELYSILSRSDSRAVASYQLDDDRGFCVIRLDEDRQTSICGFSLESILDFEREYFRGTEISRPDQLELIRSRPDDVR